MNGARHFLAVALMAAASAVWAEDYTTNLFNGTTTNFGGAFSVPASVGSSNYLIIINGGAVTNTLGTIGGSGGDIGNVAIVDGVGSLWINTGNLRIGAAGSFSQLTVTNGGRVEGALALVGSSSGNDNVALITGPTSIWVASSFFQVGDSGANNQLIVANGGTMQNVDGYIGSTGASNNVVVVTGPGSVWTNSGQLNAGHAGTHGHLIITNQGTVHGNGQPASSTNNIVVITGTGSTWQNGNNVFVGNTGPTLGSGQIVVTDGGTLEAKNLTGGVSGSGTITNVGGVYQFINATPAVTPNTAGAIMMSNATVSYRGVVGADIHNAQVGNISKSGNNAFQLNNSTNANPGTYKFDSVANTGNPTNYERLVLLNNSRWVSTHLTNGVGGAIRGGAGDVVEITGSFTIQRSVNTSAEFDLASSEVAFTGGSHTFGITGKDFGHNGTNGFADGFTAVNFSLGELSLGSAADTISFTSGDGASSNALYVLHLDLLGTTNNVANLDAPSNINIYYGISSLAPANAYLGDRVYQLASGGLLMPAIPEPSTMILLALAACAMMRGRGSR